MSGPGPGSGTKESSDRDTKKPTADAAGARSAENRPELTRDSDRKGAEAEERKERSKIEHPKDGVGFGYGTAKLNDEGKARIAEEAQRLKGSLKEGETIVVNGNASRPGGDDVNNALSRDRAEAVKAEFVRNGIPADRIEVVSFGAEAAKASGDGDNKDNAGWRTATWGVREAEPQSKSGAGEKPDAKSGETKGLGVEVGREIEKGLSKVDKTVNKALETAKGPYAQSEKGSKVDEATKIGKVALEAGKALKDAASAFGSAAKSSIFMVVDAAKVQQGLPYLRGVAQGALAEATGRPTPKATDAGDVHHSRDRKTFAEGALQGAELMRNNPQLREKINDAVAKNGRTEVLNTIYREVARELKLTSGNPSVSAGVNRSALKPVGGE